MGFEQSTRSQGATPARAVSSSRKHHRLPPSSKTTKKTSRTHTQDARARALGSEPIERCHGHHSGSGACGHGQDLSGHAGCCEGPEIGAGGSPGAYTARGGCGGRAPWVPARRSHIKDGTLDQAPAGCAKGVLPSPRDHSHAG